MKSSVVYVFSALIAFGKNDLLFTFLMALTGTEFFFPEGKTADGERSFLTLNIYLIQILHFFHLGLSVLHMA